jgi:ubiquilin
MSEVTVNVKASNDQKYVITLKTTDTVQDFKDKIAEKCDTAADRMRLIYSGRVLKDQDTIESYKIAEGHTVHMVRSTVAAASTASAATPAASAVPAATPAAPVAPTPASTTATATPAAAAGMFLTLFFFFFFFLFLLFTILHFM